MFDAREALKEILDELVEDYMLPEDEYEAIVNYLADRGIEV